MNDFHELLKRGDPVASDPGLSATEVARMRRAVMDGVPAVRDAHPFWPHPTAVAAGLVLAVCAGLLIGSRQAPAGPVEVSGPIGAQSIETPAPEPAKRQLQFTTPGGTRIIWVFDPDLEL